MTFKQTKLDGVYVVTQELREDPRGYFTRVFCRHEYENAKIPFDIVQINKSKSVMKGTIRGMHYQREPHAEDKIVQCIKGAIFDVAVDLRPSSPTRGQWVGQELTEDNNTMLLVPKGFAHGFQTLTDNTIVMYFVSQYYTAAAESGIRWNDPAFAITWPIQDATLSEKDAAWPDYTTI